MTPFPMLPRPQVPLLGFVEPPLHRHHRQSSLPDEPSPVLRRAADQATHSFRPCRSTRLRRFTPPAASQVCCTLQPVMGFAVFRWCVLDTNVERDGRTTSSTAPTLRSLSPAKSRDASPRPLPSRRCSYKTTAATFSRRCGHHPSRSTSGPFSICRAAANAPPLPVECCSLLPWASRSGVCLVRPAARQSYGLTIIGRADDGGLLVHPGRTQGQQPPSPMVLIGSGTEPASRAPRRAPPAETADTGFLPCHPLCSCESSTVRCRSVFR